MKRHARLITALLILLLVFAHVAFWPSISQSALPGQATSPASTPIVPTVGGLVTDLEMQLERIYVQVNPSVVNIQVRKAEKVSILPSIPGFPFSDREMPPAQQFTQAVGSGFVWDKEGHIVTNNHVVEGADRITVTFADGTVTSAQIVGRDPDSDLAVLKVNVPTERLQPVQLADSTQVKVGQISVALGNPFGLQGTMTVGFISALGRLLPTGDSTTEGPTYSIPDVIQTDTPINPGNSGGVLVDDQGRVIGVTSAIISPSRASAGIGFAIPSAIVQKVVPELIKTGSYQHPWLGIAGMSLMPDIAKAMGLNDNQRGALVVDVTPGSPAEKAGLKGSDRQVEIEGEQVRVGGDVITAIDGQPVARFDDLVTYLARNVTVGQKITLTILRGGKEQTVEVTVGARPRSENAQAETGTTGRAWLGVVGVTVTAELAQAMDLPPDQQGVLVQQVEQGSPADRAGLRGSYKPVSIRGQRILVGGDIITAADDRPIQRIQDLRNFVARARPGQKVTLTILREGKEIKVSVTLAERPSTTS